MQKDETPATASDERNGSPLPLPFTSRLSAPLEAGQSLVFQGTVDPDARHFELSLIAGKPDDPEQPEKSSRILLQICFHFEVGIAVLNSNLLGDDAWGEEECHSNPFFHSKPFDVRIRLHEDKFELFANQIQWAIFKHRADFRQIDHIQVSGDLSLSAVHWGGRYFQMPYEMPFHGHPLESGQRLFIHGIPREDFAVSLVGEQKGMVLFHLGAKFADQKVTRNAMINGEWGVAEQHEGEVFPFRKGEVFDLVIVNEPVALQVFVNGHSLCTFFHRCDDPHADYRALRIEGAVELSGVEVSVCWESVGGVANCCKHSPAMAQKLEEQKQVVGMTM